MTEAMIQQPPSQESEKELLWRKIAEEVEELADVKSHEVDAGIKETVIAFKANEMPTYQSCEGHLDRGLPLPWVEVEYPGEPKYKYEGEEETLKRLAAMNSTPLEELKRGYPPDLYKFARAEVSKKEYSAEYKEWMEAQEALMHRVDAVLSEFYAKRQEEVAENIRIVNMAGTVQSNEPRTVAYMEDDLTEQEFEQMKSLLEPRRAEMSAFTQFLKERFFNGAQ